MDPVQVNQITVLRKSFVQLIDQLNVMTELVNNLIVNANITHNAHLENVVVLMDLANLNKLVVELLSLVQNNYHINVMIILVDNIQTIVHQSHSVLVSLLFYVLMVLFPL
jgi:hypothetical protein